jgi:hypothetical protein
MDFRALQKELGARRRVVDSGASSKGFEDPLSQSRLNAVYVCVYVCVCEAIKVLLLHTLIYLL